MISASSQATRTEAAALQDWQASGRLGVVATEQSGSGAFIWRQSAGATQLSVRGPAGIGALSIESQQGVLRMRSADGMQFDAEAALAALSMRLGSALPLVPLQYWLRGLAAPTADGDPGRWLAAGQLLQQQGWLIRYEEWAALGLLRLPTRLVMTQEQSPPHQGSVRIVVRIQSWQVF